VLPDFKFGIFHGRDCYKVFESDVKDANVCFQTSNLASFTVEIATRFLSLMSKMIRILSYKDEVASCHIKGGSNKHNFDWTTLFSVLITAAKW